MERGMDQNQQQSRTPAYNNLQEQAVQLPFNGNNPHLQQQLQMLWRYQLQEIEYTSDFKNYQLPLARIKKVMKADEDVHMISAEAPILFAKACELFILDLTIRSWNHAEERNRRTLQKNDIGVAITQTDSFDFLVDIAPRSADMIINEPEMGLAARDPPPAAIPTTPGLQPYISYPPMASGVMIGHGQPTGVDGMMGHQQHTQMRLQAWPPLWQQGLPEELDDRSYGERSNLDGQQFASPYPPPPPGSQ